MSLCKFTHGLPFFDAAGLLLTLGTEVVATGGKPDEAGTCRLESFSRILKLDKVV